MHIHLQGRTRTEVFHLALGGSCYYTTLTWFPFPCPLRNHFMLVEPACPQPLSKSAWSLPLLSSMSLQPGPDQFRDLLLGFTLCKALLGSMSDTKSPRLIILCYLSFKNPFPYAYSLHIYWSPTLCQALGPTLDIEWWTEETWHPNFRASFA